MLCLLLVPNERIQIEKNDSGRRKSFLLSFSLSVLVNVLTALSPYHIVFLGLRFVAGFGMGVSAFGILIHVHSVEIHHEQMITKGTFNRKITNEEI